MASNQLTRAIEPYYSIPEMVPDDYIHIGAAVVGIAYRNKWIREKYSIRTGLLEGYQSVAWSRYNSDFVLAEIEENKNYFLQSIFYGNEDTGDVVNMHVFGDLPKAGLVRPIHVLTKKTPSQVEFIAQAKLAGKITQDSSRLTHKDPAKRDILSFRRSIFSIIKT